MNTNKQTFNINDVAFDMQAKEHVIISNQICTLDHSNREAFKASHGENGMGACQFVPHEAIAIRAFPEANGNVLIGWTYRGVDHKQLRPVEQSAKDMFLAMFNRKSSKYYIGRI